MCSDTGQEAQDPKPEESPPGLGTMFSTVDLQFLE